MKNVLVLIAAAGIAASASAQNFNLGNLFVTDTPQSIDLNGASVPAGVYTGYTVSFDWVAGGGDPWSVEAIWALSSDSQPAFGTFYADPSSASNSASDGNPVTLTWSGQFSRINVETGAVSGSNYNGGDSLWFTRQQTYGGSNANWNNVQISLNQTATPQIFSEAFASGTTATGNSFDRPNRAGTSISGSGPVEYALVEFFVDTDGVYDIASITPDHDGYLHIYQGSFDPNNQLANFLAGDDDGPTLGTESSVVDGISLTAGTSYFAVISGYELGEAGVFSLNAVGPGNVFIPTPSTAALLGLGGLMAARRRR